jgi:hypothetical protein
VESNELPIVRKHARTNDPAVQTASVQQGVGRWSHEEELPLRLKTPRVGWFGRKLSATTTELVWYRDAITYIEVPAGFTYDLASVPRLLWVLVSPWDIALEALFHDLFYRQQQVKRSVADATLKSMMEDRGVPFHIRWAVYLAVRVFGFKAWNEYTRLNAAAVAVAVREELELPSAVAPDKVETPGPTKSEAD